MEIRSYNGVFNFFKNVAFEDVCEELQIKTEYMDWLFHIIHNNFDEDALVQKFGIEKQEALIFLEIVGEHLRNWMHDLQSANICDKCGHKSWMEVLWICPECGFDNIKKIKE